MFQLSEYHSIFGKSDANIGSNCSCTAWCLSCGMFVCRRICSGYQAFVQRLLNIHHNRVYSYRRLPLSRGTYGRSVWWKPFLNTVSQKYTMQHVSLAFTWSMTPIVWALSHTKPTSSRNIESVEFNTLFCRVTKCWLLAASEWALQHLKIFIDMWQSSWNISSLSSKLSFISCNRSGFTLHFNVHSQNCEKLLLASSFTFVCLSVCMEQFFSHWMEILCLIFKNAFDKV